MRNYRLLFVFALSAATLLGCAGTPSPPEEGAYPNIRVAARYAAAILSQQISNASWSGASAIWVAPAINYHSGELTASGRELQIMMALDMQNSLGDTVVHSLGGEARKKWDWVLSPSVVFEPPKDLSSGQSWFRINISGTDSRGRSLPGVVLRVNANNFDATPSKFYRESPLFLTGNYQQTRHEFAKGSRSLLAQEARNQFLSVEGALQDAVLKYETGDFRGALAGFEKVIDIDPKNLAALSGRYQSLYELGVQNDVEAALGALIRAAVEQDNISMKFLFQVRSVEFRDDGNITPRYHLWLRQMARQLFVSGRCILVVGHASRSGAAEFNRQLSLSRARYVASQLLKNAPGLKERLRAEGKGYEENLVGSGSDDATDAIDRRVDFRIEDCKSR